MTWVFMKSEQLWTVGYYKPDGRFYPVQDFPTQRDAAQYVNYLNGGEKQPQRGLKGQ